MICTICHVDVAACRCADQDTRLHDAAYDPDGLVAFKWCRTCDRHYARCTCVAPAFFVICGGREIPLPAGGFRNAAGGHTVPDLTKR